MNMTRVGTFLRLFLAAVFAVMSLLHAPAMAYAAPQPAPVFDLMPEHGSHHHHPMPDDAAAPACNGFACFQAVEIAAVEPTPLHAMLHGRLTIRPDAAPAFPTERPDTPPPRS